jgi:murein DD-endopeptidase MepM/ murein hydrolase activator NlpD
LPDPSRLYRRVTESNVPTRVIAHLSVVTLVVAASFAGFSSTSGHDGAGPSTDRSFLPLISSVRGAAAPTQELTATTYDVDAMIEEQATLLDRGTSAGRPNEPMPTPVPVDPDATPLPAPNGASVGTVSVGVPSTRTARPAATGALVWPVPGGTISQYYHAGHLALDIAAPYGSQIVAAQSGTVTWAGWRNNGGGYVIQIDHGNGMQTVYNHLAGLWVSAGQYVAAGQAIAPVGMTGIATGPHCHFDVIVNGVIDNPLRYF